MPAITDVIQQFQSQDLFFTFSSDGLKNATFAVSRFQVQEKVSMLFTIDVDLVSEEENHDLTKMMDQPAKILVHDRYAEKVRYFHGVVASASKGDSGHHRTAYRVTLKPALHRTQLTSDSRIFQQMCVPEIIETVLKENGIQDYRLALFEKRAVREYLTQYQERDFTFLERLMAEEGMLYYFEHMEAYAGTSG